MCFLMKYKQQLFFVNVLSFTKGHFLQAFNDEIITMDRVPLTSLTKIDLLR